MTRPRTPFRPRHSGATPPTLLAGLLVLAGCATGGPGAASPPDPTPASTPVVQPGSPGEEGRILSPRLLAELPRPPHTDADVRFMQDMILHHAQALEMTRLVPDRSGWEDVRLLARRIDISQGSEIALMRRWLLERGEEAPDPLGQDHAGHAAPDAGHGAHAAHHAGHGDPALDPHADHGDMPGMLTPAQLQELAEARGDDFDRLFLEFMIFHHEGALTMVADLFASPASAQGGDIFEFASHVDSDQRIEIARMTRMLDALR
jgi:uncharacterized protein (DUF305 family)